MNWNRTRNKSWLAGWLSGLAAFPVSIWIRKQEQKICLLGVPLEVAELEIARKAGVRHPERVRVLAVARVPFPLDQVARQLARWSRRFPFAALGLSARYGIYLQAGIDCRAEILAHELVHTGQYERLGGVVGFLRAYLRDCIEHGYLNAVMEEEARTTGAQALEGTE